MLSLSYPGTPNTYNYEKKIKTIMVKNSTNVNETNNHFSPEPIKHKKKTQIHVYNIGNPGPSLGQPKYMEERGGYGAEISIKIIESNNMGSRYKTTDMIRHTTFLWKYRKQNL